MKASAEQRPASFRRVVAPGDTSPSEAAELVWAIVRAPATPAANALNHLMEDVAELAPKRRGDEIELTSTKTL